MSRRPAPERTCVATREARPRDELVHLVALPDGTVEVDRSGRLDGRGAWVAPTRAAVATLEAKPSLLARALDRPDVRVAGLLDKVRAAAWAVALDHLSLCARSGRLASGADQVESAVRAGELAALLVASDASPRSVATVVGRRELPVFALALDREALGLRIGKGPRAMVGVRPGGPSAGLLLQLRRIESLR